MREVYTSYGNACRVLSNKVDTDYSQVYFKFVEILPKFVRSYILANILNFVFDSMVNKPPPPY